MMMPRVIRNRIGIGCALNDGEDEHGLLLEEFVVEPTDRGVLLQMRQQLRIHLVELYNYIILKFSCE